MPLGASHPGLHLQDSLVAASASRRTGVGPPLLQRGGQPLPSQACNARISRKGTGGAGFYNWRLWLAWPCLHCAASGRWLVQPSPCCLVLWTGQRHPLCRASVTDEHATLAKPSLNRTIRPKVGPPPANGLPKSILVFGQKTNFKELNGTWINIMAIKHSKKIYFYISWKRWSSADPKNSFRWICKIPGLHTNYFAQVLGSQVHSWICFIRLSSQFRDFLIPEEEATQATTWKTTLASGEVVGSVTNQVHECEELVHWHGPWPSPLRLRLVGLGGPDRIFPAHRDMAWLTAVAQGRDPLGSMSHNHRVSVTRWCLGSWVIRANRSQKHASKRKVLGFSFECVPNAFKNPWMCSRPRTVRKRNKNIRHNLCFQSVFSPVQEKYQTKC